MSSTIASEWSRRVAAEYRSAALAAQLAHLGLQLGLPHERIRAALVVVADELDHAESSSQVVRSYGDLPPPALDPAQLAWPAQPTPLTTLLALTLRAFCIGETLAVPLFQAMRRGTTDPQALAVITRVLTDEVRHRRLGWEVLAPDAREAAQAMLPTMLADVERGYAFAPDGPDPTPEERAAGLLGTGEYHRIFWTTVRGPLAERFQARGIALPARWSNPGDPL